MDDAETGMRFWLKSLQVNKAALNKHALTSQGEDRSVGKRQLSEHRKHKAN